MRGDAGIWQADLWTQERASLEILAMDPEIASEAREAIPGILHRLTTGVSER
jgi:hypothetical protein